MTQPTTITLNDGATIPQLGFGVFQVDSAQTQEMVETALEAGYRHIDTAAAYNNEAGVGAALRASGLSRDEVFITTKLRNGDQGYDSALRAYQDSLVRVGLETVDLYLIHWPKPMDDLYSDSWKALNQLKQDGRVRSIGVSNFLPEHLDRIINDTGVKPTLNQIELHPTFQQTELVDYCRQLGVAVESYSPLGRGTDLEQPAVVAAAEKYGVAPAQVVIRWHLQNGYVVIDVETAEVDMALEQLKAIPGTIKARVLY